eukprot:2581561-Rhodomonas_salina.2
MTFGTDGSATHSGLTLAIDTTPPKARLRLLTGLAGRIRDDECHWRREQYGPPLFLGVPTQGAAIRLSLVPLPIATATPRRLGKCDTAFVNRGNSTGSLHALP